MKRLQNELVKIQEKIKKYQLKCQHLNVVETPRGNTGNYDPNDDKYWTEYSCPDCLKQWSVEYK
jgi:hypothetical protein